MPAIELLTAIGLPGVLGWEAVGVLAIAAFGTAALSALVGMAGGMILLAVLLIYADPLTAIPLHAAVQLISNGSRTWIQRRSVRQDVVWWYAALLIPAGFLGVAFAKQLAPDALRATIGVFVLLATWAPRVLRLGSESARNASPTRFVVLGGVAGFLNVTIGATGPLTAPFFRSLGLDRFGLIGTLAASQTLGHLAKICVFGVAGFAFYDYAALLTLLAGMVIAGTRLGSQLLESANAQGFKVLYKTALTLLGLRLVVLAGLAALN